MNIRSLLVAAKQIASAAVNLLRMREQQAIAAGNVAAYQSCAMAYNAVKSAEDAAVDKLIQGLVMAPPGTANQIDWATKQLNDQLDQINHGTGNLTNFGAAASGLASAINLIGLA